MPLPVMDPTCRSRSASAPPPGAGPAIETETGPLRDSPEPGPRSRSRPYGSAGRRPVPWKETGRPGVASREAKMAHSSSVSAAWRPTSASSDPSLTRPSGRTASSRMARTSASMLRPRRAARTLSPRWTSSRRFRTVRSRILRPPFMPPLRQEIEEAARHVSAGSAEWLGESRAKGLSQAAALVMVSP